MVLFMVMRSDFPVVSVSKMQFSAVKPETGLKTHPKLRLKYFNLTMHLFSFCWSVFNMYFKTSGWLMEEDGIPCGVF